jgi:hypothetical protein
VLAAIFSWEASIVGFIPFALLSVSAAIRTLLSHHGGTSTPARAIPFDLGDDPLRRRVSLSLSLSLSLAVVSEKSGAVRIRKETLESLAPWFMWRVFKSLAP